jgi:DNA-directed RNA polymerase specialized sigma24 family protein
MSAAIAITFDCDRCEDAKQIQHPTMGDIRCPRCNPRKRKPDPSGLALLSRREAERREQEAVNATDLAEELRRQTGIAGTVALLLQWGRRVRDRGLGYPSMAAIEKARVGRGFGREAITELPPDLQAVDLAVSQSPVDFKAVLVEHYTKAGFGSEKAARLGISRSTYYQRKASAERHVANLIGL